MKKFGLVLLLIIAFVCGIIGYRHVTINQGYEATMTNAHNALNKQNWSDAKFYYQEAQKEKKSVEARTALDQLVYAIRADKSANKGDWQDALDWYHTAKVVDGAVDLVNENIDVAVRKVKTSRASSEAKVSSSKAASVASSKAASASIAASQSKQRVKQQPHHEKQRSYHHPLQHLLVVHRLHNQLVRHSNQVSLLAIVQLTAPLVIRQTRRLQMLVQFRPAHHQNVKWIQRMLQRRGQS